jgi:hypothetical protein
MGLIDVHTMYGASYNKYKFMYILLLCMMCVELRFI